MQCQRLCHSSYVAKYGRWFGWAARAASGLPGCAGPLGPRCSRWKMSGRGRACARSRPDLCYCGWWASIRTARVRGAAQAPLMADVWAGPRIRLVSPGSLLLRLVGFSRGWTSRGSGGCLGRAARGRGLARILATAVSGLRLGQLVCAGLPGPRMWWWLMSGRSSPGSRSRPDLCLFGRWALVRLRGVRGPSRALLVALAGFPAWVPVGVRGLVCIFFIV